MRFWPALVRLLQGVQEVSISASAPPALTLATAELKAEGVVSSCPLKAKAERRQLMKGGGGGGGQGWGGGRDGRGGGAEAGRMAADGRRGVVTFGRRETGDIKMGFGRAMAGSRLG